MAANRRRLEHGLQAGDLEDLPASGDNYTPWKDKARQGLTRPDTWLFVTMLSYGAFASP